jgi:hypothetical protein
MTFEESARLAGFVLAHAAWSMSDLAAGDLLTPVAITELEGARELIRFEAATQDEAVAEGKRAMQSFAERVDGWAFARDGLLRIRGSESAQHVLAVEFGRRAEKRPHTIIQPYAPAASASGFRILGEPVIMRGADLLDPAEVPAVLHLLHGGIQDHPAAAPLWDGWSAVAG